MKRRRFLGLSTALLASGCLGNGDNDAQSTPNGSGNSPTSEPGTVNGPTTLKTSESASSPTSVATSSSTTEETRPTTMCKETPVTRGTAIYEGKRVPCNGTASPQTKSTIRQSNSATVSQQEKTNACSGARYIEFYALESEAADELWNPSTVRVAYQLGDGANVLLVVLEDDTVLGMTQITNVGGGVVESDGEPIPLNTKLSGNHTIRAAIYPNTGTAEQFSAEDATPCQLEGKAVQTESTTIDFSRFSENTPTTSQ